MTHILEAVVIQGENSAFQVQAFFIIPLYFLSLAKIAPQILELNLDICKGHFQK